ncbi:14 kDa phosphohistidine phosphatase isoform X1 [Pygocentrus nattereri]|uniref:14 kDa phosphohistidine phosphatase isoform X1 n=1 Tax=Pygocentrus nattereri TaxID=42514 RepID=UPI001891BDC6|nr:14 kDa phosphohistidine phosphatase isoform X1 [Pygocentrus nattereri]
MRVLDAACVPRLSPTNEVSVKRNGDFPFHNFCGENHCSVKSQSCEIIFKLRHVIADIYDKVSGDLERAGGVDCECVGGGRIKHDSAEKKIHVYGYSMGFGRANHAVSTEKLKVRYPDYEITWANEGY